MTGYIWHVALGTGDATRETRDHLSDAQLAAWRGHIDSALLHDKGEPIPDKPGYATAMQAISGVLLCTVGRTGDATPLCTFSVVTKSTQAVKAWRALHEGYPAFDASLNHAPRVPYCAVRAEIGLAYDRGAGAWLDAYQIAIAFAWIEKRHD